MMCQACQAWITPVIDKAAHTLTCPLCGHVEMRRLYPLFIVTGPSGVGKTTVVNELQRLLPAWDVFDIDILWDSGGDWQMVKANWLRIADFLAQNGRLTILCGTLLPDDLAACPSHIFFSTIYWWHSIVIQRPWRYDCTRDQPGVAAMKNSLSRIRRLPSGLWTTRRAHFTHP